MWFWAVTSVMDETDGRKTSGVKSVGTLIYIHCTQGMHSFDKYLLTSMYWKNSEQNQAKLSTLKRAVSSGDRQVVK